MKFDRLFWGMLFAFIGLLILGSNLHWWSSDSIQYLWHLWPLLLIILGVRLIFGDGMIVVFILFLSALVSLAYVTDFQDIRQSIQSISKREIASDNSEKISDLLRRNNETEAIYNLNLGALKLKISDLPPYTSNLYETDHRLYYPLETKQTGNDSRKEITFKEKATRLYLGQKSQDRYFNLFLAPDVDTVLNLNIGASSLTLDLEKLKINNLYLNTGATEGEIKFGSLASSVKAEINTGASKYSLKVPKDTGVKIETSGALVTNNFSSQGLIKNDEVFKSDNYDSAGNKIDFKIKAGVSTINLEHY